MGVNNRKSDILADMNNIFNILPGFFEGKSSAEEQGQVEAWKQENAEEFEFLEMAWEESSSIEFRQFDAPKAWDKINSQISPSSSGRIIPLRKRTFSLVAIAVATFGP